ncbi:PfaD family polyunsaturated fatty acid/polyketide biosynthesis protein [Chryseobacterium sp. MYb264]|uniref:PfaD family polyunsaturated fatty acid/polyketide biosynthesis protein n=1 Tax=Chryseobacterium sp. MYb264 TaxID=2745153 RepID=UPI002E13D1E6|nr:PfaD family polyunsaturated fatty acid/polyketide biosynthesis protein [Chryseobacterium sp. MYb264]
MIVHCFPGKISKIKAAEALINDYKEIITTADEIIGFPLKNVITQDHLLSQIKYSDPIIFVINALIYLNTKSPKPDFLSGYGVGEYNALLASGGFDFPTGLKIVNERAHIISKFKRGKMAVVKNVTVDEIQWMLKSHHCHTIDISAHHSAKEFSISGKSTDILKMKTVFENSGAEYLMDHSEGAFHSRYMKGAINEFSEYLNKYTFNDLQIPVIAGIDGKPYQNNSVKKNLILQLINPVLWHESVEYLKQSGVNEFREIVFDDDHVVQNIKALPEQDFSDQIIPKVNISDLGSKSYQKRYHTTSSYAAGGMYKGVSSSDLVIALGKNSMMSYLGSGGLPLQKVEMEIVRIQKELGADLPFGINIVYNIYNSDREKEMIDLCLKYGVRNIEAAAYMSVTPQLVKFRLNGLKKTDHTIMAENNIQAKVSIPEIAIQFMKPAPENIVMDLYRKGEISKEEMEYAKYVPVASDICVEADSGGHTDRGILSILLPAVIKLRDEFCEKYNYPEIIHIGAAGGIGNPESAAAAFILGADYIVTGSINQCTVEAGTSNTVKDLLEKITIHDTAYAPAGDMFELGAKVQVVKKDTFFPMRASRLYDIYSRYNSLDEIDAAERSRIEKKFFGKTFQEVFEECKKYHSENNILKAENDPKYKMAMIFKWYFGLSSKMALAGEENHIANFQIHCGSALGSFNHWVKGTALEHWRNRKVAVVATSLLECTANHFAQFIQQYANKVSLVNT